MSAEISLQETETAGGWVYRGHAGEDGTGRGLEMSLSWADYEYWSRGLVRPVDVALALLRIASDQIGTDLLPDRFDAARLRRTIPRFDERVRVELGFEEVEGERETDPGGT